MMTETTTSSSGSSAVESTRLDGVTEPPPEPAELDKAQREAIAQMVRQAKDAGIALTGPDGLLKALTAQVVEAALDEELNEHLGYDKHDPVGRGSGNSRNGTRSKTVVTDNVGAIQIDVPRDRNGTFEPQLVKKRQRRLSDMDAMVLSLFAKGLTTGEIAAHFAEVYGTSVSKDTISRITDRVVDEMNGWMSRPLEPIYAAIFIDAIVIKVRDGQVRNQPYYAAIGVDLEGHKDILGIWPGNGDGESAKFWFACLTELKNRGVKDVFFMVCDGLKGLPDSIGNVFGQAKVQTCLIHLLRNSFGYASKRHWPEIAANLRPVYEAPTPQAAERAFEEFAEKWGKAYPAMIRLWRNAWTEFVPFLDYDVEIRKVLCSTNAIESLNARFRRAVRARGHFPNEQAALKTLYLTVRSLDPKGTGQTRWGMRWKPALNAFATTFADRMPAASTTQ